ncbi:transposon Ty3-G Gag-Pol polyprotein [Trichonephila clavata]|uniref:Transposon Ty3-G Gag-Pol polyprotein n=1 Tax=Trichonephila clavata TaxID=2740835 RepID=A0A8X6IG79_TRICU|nr:transposon Ty3-G Gag-Pol polyprotein [Trichonephila clavata]
MTETEKLEASGVSIKIPPLWFDKPEIWFYQVGAQFKICRITSEETMFSHPVTQLEPKVLDDIWDIVKDPTPNKHSAAKERLLKIFVESKNKQITLLTGIELGNVLPSQLLRKMAALAGTDVSEKALRTLWLDKMPDSVKGIVIVSEEYLDKIAAMVDKIVERAPRTIDVSAVQKDPVRVDQLLAEIATLKGQIASLKLQRKFWSHSPYHHQRRGRVLCGLDFVFPYVDDVLVASSTEEEHNEHLKIVFKRFQQYGLRMNISKSVMGADRIEYLGFLITADGSRPLTEKVKAITNYKLPATIHDLRTFLGMISFYRRYLKDASKT